MKNYPEKLQHYFHHRVHAGDLSHHATHNYQVQVNGTENFEVLQLSIAYGDCIVEAKFKASGSVALIAGGEFICQWLENKTWEDFSILTPQFILQELGLNQLSVHIAQMIIQAIKKLNDCATID